MVGLTGHADRVLLNFTAGKAERVAGGWRVSGRWPFSSGIDPCEWVVVGATTPTGKARRTARSSGTIFFCHAPTTRMVEAPGMWSGCAGPAVRISKSVMLSCLRGLSFSDATDGNAPGLAINTAPLFRMSMQATGGLTLMATLYGSARGAVDDYIAGIRARSGRVTGGGLADLPAVQTRVAQKRRLVSIRST